jgi:hypothetical protein
MRKFCFISLIISYVIVLFILFYSNGTPDYNREVCVTLAIVVVSVWICAPVFLYLSEKKQKAVKKINWRGC